VAALDPWALPLSCPVCKDAQMPFTADGVLFDWCGSCGAERRVPLRRPNGGHGPVLDGITLARVA
jgi:hypothetical protein